MEHIIPWIEECFEQSDSDWWQNLVINNLTDRQIEDLNGEYYKPNLEALDLAALVRIVHRNWSRLRTYYKLNLADHHLFTSLGDVRIQLAHINLKTRNKDLALYATRIFFEVGKIIGFSKKMLKELKELKQAATLLENNDQESTDSKVESSNEVTVDNSRIKINDQVCLVSDPSAIGIVIGIEKLKDSKVYKVFVNNSLGFFYEDQVKLFGSSDDGKVISVDKFRSQLTAFYLNSPSNDNLFSLGSSKIDFVPYQFRPVMKLIRSDEPRLLIADSVGVGKTIETGLIIKELQARQNIQNILVICPKSLVSEHKWKIEMERFDQNFVELDSNLLGQILHGCKEKGIGWPSNYPKCILPYSLLSHVVHGNASSKTFFKYPGLEQVKNPPHFDLVIVDEAHHIKNRETDAYKAVKYFCENAEAVVFLTATPVQLGSDDLYTLLNTLRPDVILDKSSFNQMAEPNKYIFSASSTVRGNGDNWIQETKDILNQLVTIDKWGREVIAKSPKFQKVIKQLDKKEFSRDERIALLGDIEDLNTFSGMINRTRRKDIENFCIRETSTVEIDFTEYQRAAHDKLLTVDASLLTILHNTDNVAFMMSTLRRQAASCIFGLEDSIRDLMNKRFDGVWEDMGEDMPFPIPADVIACLKDEIDEVVEMLRCLPSDYDPKFEAFYKIILNKISQQKKVIVFSSFRHTLKYLERKLKLKGIKVARVDGSISHDSRYEIRQRFAQDSKKEDAFDVVLFSEVGSEGLDYQFCDTLINYDLPWNPMRIEQRIGRIDRRGQKSDKVHIFNMVTSDTIDADIYHRCLYRIGIFQNSVGDCEEILGSITKNIQEIALDITLTEEQKRFRFEQMADNEIRKIKQMELLEEQSKQLFGLDIGNSRLEDSLYKADSYWVSPQAVRSMIEHYSIETFGKNIIEHEQRLQIVAGYREKTTLSSKLPKQTNNDSPALVLFRDYLKSDRREHKIVFESEKAASPLNSNAMFINYDHPLTKIAISELGVKEKQYLSVEVFPSEYKKGNYPFIIYSWEYSGFKTDRTLKVFCNNKEIEDDLLEILSRARSEDFDPSYYDEDWRELEYRHYQSWRDAKENHSKEMDDIKQFREESKRNNYLHKSTPIKALINESSDENVRRLNLGKLRRIEDQFEVDMEALEKRGQQSDIIFNELVRGVVIIK